MTSSPLQPKERAQWAAMLHLAILQAISYAPELAGKTMVFHGGTSLHLSWNSPRFSEDLDFLLSSRATNRLGNVMNAVARLLTRRFLA